MVATWPDTEHLPDECPFCHVPIVGHPTNHLEESEGFYRAVEAVPPGDLATLNDEPSGRYNH